MAASRRVLIVGAPRSGTTWIGAALGRTEGAVFVNEPDGDHDPFAYRARLGHGIAPTLTPGDAAPEYERLWAGAFAGGRAARTPRDRLARRVYASVPVSQRWAVWLGGSPGPRLRVAAALAVPRVAVDAARAVVVKSVRAESSVEWIAARFSPRVLVVERNPLNVLASWVELGYVRDPRESGAYAGVARRRYGVDVPPAGAPVLERQAFTYGVLASVLREAAGRHPEWVRAHHDDLCIDAPARFRALAGTLALEWGARADAFLRESDAPGAGYHLTRATRSQPDRWRQRLDAEQVETIREVLDRFPTGLLADADPPASR
jgi:hypothetical protein